MKILKQIIIYCIWTLVALLIGIGYMRCIQVVLGVNEIPIKGAWNLLHAFFYWGAVYVGLIIGVVIALLFIFLDVFYLKKKLKKNLEATIIRFLFLTLITMFVGGIHYVLEKVIDVI